MPFPVPPDRLPQAVQAIRDLGTGGINVTLPHKTAIMPLLDRVDATAEAIGAVNTVFRDGERLVGTNTDAQGLTRSLQAAGVGLQGARVVVLGAGGAARAAVVGLAQAGARRLGVAARRPDQARTLTDSLRAAVPGTELRSLGLDDELGKAFVDTDLVIQATSATLEGSPKAESFAQALPLESLGPQAVVCDLVYKPLQTRVLERAAALGLRTVDGLGMLLHQGALAFEYFTGQPAPLEVMAQALSEPAADA